MSRSLRCVDSSAFQLARAPEGARDFSIIRFHVPPPMRFNSRGLPREPAIFFPRIDQEDQGGFNSRGLPREPAIPAQLAIISPRSSFNSRGLPREPAMLAQQHLAPGVYVSTRAGSRCRFAASWDQPDGVFCRVMGPPLLQAEGTTRGGGVRSFSQPHGTSRFAGGRDQRFRPPRRVSSRAIGK